MGKPGRFAAFSSPPITTWRQSANDAAIGRSGAAPGVSRHDAEPTAGYTAATPTEYKLHRTAGAEDSDDDDAQFTDDVVRSAFPATATAVFSTTAATNNSRQVPSSVADP